MLRVDDKLKEQIRNELLDRPLPEPHWTRFAYWERVQLADSITLMLESPVATAPTGHRVTVYCRYLAELVPEDEIEREKYFALREATLASELREGVKLVEEEWRKIKEGQK